MKKILTILLCAVLLFAIIPMGAFTASAATSGYYTYTVSNNKATITACDTSISGAVTIPSTLGGYPVTAIGDSAFSWCNLLTSITIPKSVTSIGNSAFSGCSNLTSITIPDNVTIIGTYAFYYCSSLTTVTIGKRVASIGASAFEDCSLLSAINVSSNNSCFSSLDGVLYNKEKTELICYPAGRSETSYTIPGSVKTIGDSAFFWCNSLSSITIPNSVKSIGDSAFSGCGRLSSITIPKSVTSIGDYAFYYCSRLTTVTIPNNVTSIGSYAFNNCSKLSEVYYYGTVDEWNSISIEKRNEPLGSATIYYLVPVDLNGDQRFDILDLVSLKKILAGLEDTSNLADVNKDGDVDALDVSCLIEIILTSN